MPIFLNFIINFWHFFELLHGEYRSDYKLVYIPYWKLVYTQDYKLIYRVYYSLYYEL